jgi:ABC-type glutathione transport system ATPase component
LLRIDNFSLQLKGSDGRILPVLEDVSLRLEKGNCLGIAGESGSGKSVLAMSIAALLPSGAVHARSGDIFGKQQGRSR